MQHQHARVATLSTEFPPARITGQEKGQDRLQVDQGAAQALSTLLQECKRQA